MNKKIKQIVAGLLAFLILFAPIVTVFAKENTKTLVVGAGLKELEIVETINVIGEKANGLVVNKVYGEDLERFLGESGSDDSSMISSVLVEKLEKGEGVTVVIADKDKITKVKDYQYINAAITAGIEDSHIIVASVRPVTGESALTGVYKAAEIQGIKLDKDKMTAGVKELETVLVIEENNKDNKNFNSEDFSKALTEIKTQTAQKIENNNGNNIKTGDITTIINNTLQKYNINISEADKDKLGNTVDNFKNTLNSDEAKEVQKQLNDFGEKAMGKAKDLYNQAEESGFFTKVGDFFKSIFTAIYDFVASLFN